MSGFQKTRSVRLMAGAAACALLLGASAARAETKPIVIPAQSLATALHEFASQTGRPIMFSPSAADAKATAGVSGIADQQLALRQLLDGTGLTYRTEGDAFVIVSASDPQSGSAAGDGADGTVQALIVTAQKREEQIQDVPIAISAFTEKSLQEQKIEGGFDLLKAIPNVTFSKNNFSGYNFSIRGIGTKAVSVTTDPGVAVSFNSTTLIRNRLFEQEYFDVERVEVLRGPQGTLYGRNATSGVINVISAKPDLSEFAGWIKGEVGNYHAKRVSAMVNVPLVQDKLAIRVAGALTDRQGYGVDLFDNTHIDGRDLWSGRVSVGFQPTDALHADLIWERFNEDDDRARTSKQMCTRDNGPDHVGDFVLPGNDETFGRITRAYFSQGCLPGSLYDNRAFGAPNGTSLPYVLFLEGFIFGFSDTPRPDCDPNAPTWCRLIRVDSDPYQGIEQSHDLRAIYSRIKPVYRAKADVLELNLNWDIGPSLTFSSQTAYDKDSVYSTQDFNRYTTYPTFIDTSDLKDFNGGASPLSWVAPGGILCAPQVGCSDTVVAMDLSRAKSEQFSQEFRLQSNWDGPVNFNAGANYTRYRTVEDYYVFINVLSVIAMYQNSMLPTGFLTGHDPSKSTFSPDCSAPSPLGRPSDGFICIPIETNPISDLQDTGRNYFLSRNPYKLDARGLFGEIYWNIRDDLKLTGGLRYNRDEKTFIPIPSQLLLTDPAQVQPWIDSNPFWDAWRGFPLYSFASGAYPALPPIKRRWNEFTGRLGLDWKPKISFTDQTMIYAFYSRGYKGGGMNPPRIGLDFEAMAQRGTVIGASAPAEFRPEFVNAYEVGAKNTLLSGALVFNADAFYYDYQDYQVSKIVDRTANNENFDAKVWGLEFETMFQPTRNLRFNGSLGYLDTKLGDGSLSIDVMNRTAGHDDWIVVKPNVALTSNCIAPVEMVVKGFATTNTPGTLLCAGGNGFGRNFTGLPPFGETFYDGTTYNPIDYPEANYGAGFYSDVSGHELPNSPHFTVTLGAQYSHEFTESWKATIRADGYWQSQSWARVYELPIDKLHGWYNANLSLWVENDEGLKIEFYAKNILDKTPITDTFTNSDDTALTTNVFVLDPRLIGLSIKKDF